MTLIIEFCIVYNWFTLNLILFNRYFFTDSDKWNVSVVTSDKSLIRIDKKIPVFFLKKQLLGEFFKIGISNS